MPTDDLAKVTLAHLTRAERICPRRLAREHASGSGNRGATGGWGISNQVLADVRLAHTDLAVPRAKRLRPPPELTPEQAAVYELATRWYVTLFGDRPVRVVDEDPWGTDRPSEGIRLVGPGGLAFTDPDGSPELRLLHVGRGTAQPFDLAGSAPVRFALLRRPGWLDGRRVRVAVADLVLGNLGEADIDTGEVGPQLDTWLAGRLAVIHERVAHPVARPGLECGWCPFIAGCEAHR